MNQDSRLTEKSVTAPDGSIAGIPVGTYPVRGHEFLLFRVFDVRGNHKEPNTADAQDSQQRQRPAAFSVLADRLWPRGIKKEDLQPDLWDKQLCPSQELRKEFHDGLSFDDFSHRYTAELDERAAAGQLTETIKALHKAAGQGNIAILFAGKDTEHSHARILAQWLVEAIDAE